LDCFSERPNFAIFMIIVTKNVSQQGKSNFQRKFPSIVFQVYLTVASHRDWERGSFRENTEDLVFLKTFFSI
jgi:hypothetical protein